MRGEIVKTKVENYKEFKGIWKDYSRMLVMKKLGIPYAVYNEFLKKVVDETRVDFVPPTVPTDKEPYSTNEDDYGTKMFWPKCQNLDVAEKEETLLQQVIQDYISTFKLKRKWKKL